MAPADAPPPSADVLRYVTRFNHRNRDALRALLADDVKLSQSAHSLRVGRADVGMFFAFLCAGSRRPAGARDVRSVMADAELTLGSRADPITISVD